jgi:RES domain-containing protein
MLLYRIARTKWARVLDGEGASIHGGRWNLRGTPCIYTSESRALAILEYTVNTNLDDIPRSLSIITIDVADHDALRFFTPPISMLSGNWSDCPAPSTLKHFGTRLFTKSYAGLRIPSVIIPKEFNVLLNPVANPAATFRVVDIEDFVYDIRIKNT